jgi:hypothetical protein
MGPQTLKRIPIYANKSSVWRVTSLNSKRLEWNEEESGEEEEWGEEEGWEEEEW